MGACEEPKVHKVNYIFLFLSRAGQTRFVWVREGDPISFNLMGRWGHILVEVAREQVLLVRLITNKRHR